MTRPGNGLRYRNMEAHSISLPERVKQSFDTPVSNLKEIMGLYVPTLLENFILVAVALVNLGVISTLGKEIVVSIGLVDPIGVIIQYFYVAFGLTTTVLLSQLVGAGREEEAKHYFVQIVLTVFTLSAIISLIGAIFRREILIALYPTASALALDCAADYLGGVFYTGPLYVLATVTCGMTRAFGKPRRSLYITFAMNLTILLTNVVTILVFKRDYHWLMLSLTLARIVCALLVLRYVATQKHRITSFSWRKNLRPDLQCIKRVFAVSLPFTGENTIFYLGRLLLQMIAVRLGATAATVNTITNTVMNFFQCTGNSMSTVSLVVVGRSIGMRDIKSARKYTHIFHISASVLNALMLGATLLLFRPIMRMLNADAETLPLVLVNVLIIGIANIIVWPRGFLVANCLKAAGDITFTTVAAVATMWSIRVLFSYLLSIPLGLGVTGIWVATALEWLVRAVIFTLRYHGTHGFAHRLI